MATKAALICIEPENEIRFIGPFNTTVSAQLKLTNMTENQGFFRIKTTAPRSYCVRPNYGLIGSMEVAIVQVMVQPFDYNHNDSEMSKHKFMVRSRYAPENATLADSDNAFKSVTEGIEMHDARLKCVFELPQSEDDNLDPAETTTQEDPSLRLEMETIRKRNAALIMENIELKKIPRHTPVMSHTQEGPSLRLEVETIRKRNAALIMENIELKKSSSGHTPVMSHSPGQAQKKTSTLLNILTEEMGVLNSCLKCGFELPTQSEEDNPFSTREPLQHSFEKKVNLDPAETTTQEGPSLRLEEETIRKLNILLALIVLVLGKIIGKSF